MLIRISDIFPRFHVQYVFCSKNASEFRRNSESKSLLLIFFLLSTWTPKKLGQLSLKNAWTFLVVAALSEQKLDATKAVQIENWMKEDTRF